MPFPKVLVANRGAIACRIFRTLHRMGIGSVAVYSEADRHSLHVLEAREAVLVGPPPAKESYLDTQRILDAARATGATAIHPGYGFLSENAEFAEACAAAGIRFIGPRPEHLRAFGLKHTARQLAAESGVPLLPGSGLLANIAEAVAAADAIGYPVMLKSTAGGGGIGMQLCRTAAELEEAFDKVTRLGKANFKDGGVYLERFVEHARHIEVQIFGDGKGHVLALGERDCSVQRRNQKVIEETPAPGLSSATREALFSAAIELGRKVRYASAGTVEFVYDQARGDFYFLEVNTRLQVEHGVTEEVTGIDLVEWMVREAGGQWSVPTTAPPAAGSSIQVRLYAEDPARNFQPCAGKLTHVTFPDAARIETWIEPGSEVSPFYDPLLAKVIVRADTREKAVHALEQALASTRLEGAETNLDYLRAVAAAPEFRQGAVTTAYLRTFPYQRRAIEVLDPGTQTTIQDHPGRLGYWHVGVPPSGPMDDFSFRMANRLAGNSLDAAAMECAVTGPTLRFDAACTIAITGADMAPKRNGEPIPMWRTIAMQPGDVLQMGAARTGVRAYLAVSGGFDVPAYLGSKSTFLLGKFGGHAGRAFRPGDIIRFHSGTATEACYPHPPAFANEWNIGVLYGPHGAPDFFTPADIDMFFSTAWKVHYNSDRTGVRLIGPKPQWARPDGGEAGLHPSNIHDNAYAIGTVDFTGDMPVILGPDGPSLGGFVCPATIVAAELWKLGQLRPGDRVRFHALSAAEAQALEQTQQQALSTAATPLADLPAVAVREGPILNKTATRAIRADGDRNLLLEYGPNVLDLNLRFRVHALEQELRRLALPGIVDLTPGIRSLQIHYDSRRLPREALLTALDVAETALPDLDNLEVPSRIVHLPLSWDDPATQLAIRKYMQSVRPDAPWCPSNIEFIRRINGLSGIEDVRHIVFDASYLVLGLGDVYLGAPVATPVDPRHRLVTTKYNPARTWTPENAVGIGGAYLCVYGMEGPGGYQFVGRTLQMWNTFKSTPAFPPGTPWLLRFFDRIRFFPVSADELLDIREAFPHGRYELRTEEKQFSLRAYHHFLDDIQQQTAQFRQTQQQAFLAERDRWAAAGQAMMIQPPEDDGPPPADADVPEGCHAVRSPITASVWSIPVEPGQPVEAGQKLVILEAMKMEVAVTAPVSGTVRELRCKAGNFVTPGQSLVVVA